MSTGDLYCELAWAGVFLSQGLSLFEFCLRLGLSWSEFARVCLSLNLFVFNRGLCVCVGGRMGGFVLV
jgi:hypothetical protein